MKYFLPIIILLSSFANAVEKPPVAKVDPHTEKLCNTLGETYLTAYQKAMDDIDYTDILFSVAISYDGNSAGLYLIMHTIKDAYHDKIADMERFKGAGEFKKRCYKDELINQIVNDYENNPDTVIEEKITF